MKTTLISVAERHEHLVDVAVIKRRDSAESDDVRLQDAQIVRIIDELMPVLKLKRLDQFSEIRLVHMVDGVPKLAQAWSLDSPGTDADGFVSLGMGRKLYLVGETDLTLGLAHFCL